MEKIVKKTEFKQIIESMPNALIVSNESGKIIMANKKMEDLFGYTKDELYKSTVDLLIPKRYSKQHPEHIKSFVSKPSARSMGANRDLLGLKKNGDEFPIEIGLNPITINNNNNNNNILVIAAIVDITKRKAQELKIQSALNLLKFNNDELKEFTYITSHDLQEPLRTISSFTKLINDEHKDELSEDLKTYINFISESSDRLRDLITNLLDYTRLGNLEKTTLVDCNVLIKEILADFTVSISESKSKISLAAPLPTITGSKPGLRILFQNLISNAIKFKKKDTLPQVKISFKEDSEKWLFYIQDNGIGMKEKDLTKIFSLFTRLHNRERYEGTGIGLAYCMKVVKKHNGNIWVDSELGKGSTFYFTISKTLI
jgi:PAS domain S-box-containing protein